MFTRAFTALALLGVLAAAPAAGAATPAGKATYVRGIATVQGDDGRARIIARNAPIYEGDVVRTAARSYAVLALDDESKITLRPDTVFKVEGFQNEAREDDSVLLRLFKGGMRAITGLVGRRNPRGFQVRSAVATIGIRGTDFEARLCEEDCAREAAGARRAATPASRVIGRVAFLSGAVQAAGRDGTTRSLALGASLLEGDVLETGPRAVAVLVFRDESRVTMRAGSRLQVDQYAFDRDDPDKSSVAMSFLRGGVRFVSGLIARLRPDRVEINTPVATIAVRGTGFELKCEDPCSAAEQAGADRGLLDLLLPAAHAQAATAGMTTFVFDGVIEFRLPGGTLTIDQGKAVFFDGVRPPVTLPNVPVYFQQVSAAQQTIDANTSGEVVASTTAPQGVQAQPEQGLYVTVRSGDVEVTKTATGESTLAGPGETVFSSPLAQAPVVKVFMERPPLPVPSPEVLSTEAPQISPALPGEDPTEPQTEFECVVQ